MEGNRIFSSDNEEGEGEGGSGDIAISSLEFSIEFCSPLGADENGFGTTDKFGGDDPIDERDDTIVEGEGEGNIGVRVTEDLCSIFLFFAGLSESSFSSSVFTSSIILRISFTVFPHSSSFTAQFDNKAGGPLCRRV